jgi:hypothetical protein
VRIPQLNPLNVAPTSARAPSAGVPQAQGFEALKQVGANFARAAGEFGEGAKELYQRQEKAAQAKQTTDLYTDLQNEVTTEHHGTTAAVPAQDDGADRVFSVAMGKDGPTVTAQKEQVPGFLSTRGEEALAKVDAMEERLEEARRKLASRAKSNFAKEKFLEESRRLLDGARQRSRSHVANEVERGKEDSIKAGLAQTNRTVSLNPLDETGAQEQVAVLAGRTAAMFAGRPKEVVEAAINDIRAGVAATRAEVLIERGSWDAAEMVVKGSEKALGEKATGKGGFYSQIAKGRELAVKQAESDEAQELASAIVGGSLRDDGSVDEDAIRVSVEATPGPQRAKVEDAVKQKVVQARQAYDAGTSRLLSEAVASFNLNGWTKMPLDIKERLNNRSDDPRGPELYKQLEHASDLELEKLERKSRIRLNNRAAIKEQTDIDRITKFEWERELLRDPKGASLDLFIATHKGASDTLMAELPNMQLKMQKQAEKGLLTSRAEFLQTAADSARGFIAAKAGQRKEKDAAAIEEADFKAAAGRAWDAYFEKHEKEPLPADAHQMANDTISSYVRRSGAPLKPQTPEAAIRHGKEVVEQVAKAGQPPPTQLGSNVRLIPADARERAIKRIRESGKPLTEDLIYQVYDYERQQAQRKAKVK